MAAEGLAGERTAILSIEFRERHRIHRAAPGTVSPSARFPIFDDHESPARSASIMDFPGRAHIRIKRPTRSAARQCLREERPHRPPAERSRERQSTERPASSWESFDRAAEIHARCNPFLNVRGCLDGGEGGERSDGQSTRGGLPVRLNEILRSPEFRVAFGSEARHELPWRKRSQKEGEGQHDCSKR